MTDYSTKFKTFNIIAKKFNTEVKNIFDNFDEKIDEERNGNGLLLLQVKRFDGWCILEGNLFSSDDDGDDEENHHIDLYLKPPNTDTRYISIGTIYRKEIEKPLDNYINIFIDKIYSLVCCKSCLNYDINVDKELGICYTCAQDIFNDELNEIKKECSVCLDDECLAIHNELKCGHSFHLKCLKQVQDKKCPLCRAFFYL